jgi:hypothetical protein
LELFGEVMSQQGGSTGAESTAATESMSSLPPAVDKMEDGNSAAEVASVDGDSMVIDLQEQAASVAEDVIVETPVSQPITVQPTEPTQPSPAHDYQQASTINTQAIQRISTGLVSTSAQQFAAVAPLEAGSLGHQLTSPQLPAPLAILSSVDQQHMAASSSSAAGAIVIAGGQPSQQQQQLQTMCQQFIQSTATQHVTATTDCSLVAGISSNPVYAAGPTQIMCSSETAAAAVQSQMEVALACHQQFIGSGQTFQGLQPGQNFQSLQTAQAFQGLQSGPTFQGLPNAIQGPLMALPQTLQVIQATPQQFVQQQFQQQQQQQYMFQTNPIQTFQPVPTAVSLSAPRSVAKSPSILPIAPQSVSVARVSSAPLSVAAKGSTVQVPHIHTTVSASKPQQQQQPQQQNTSFVIGQLAAAGMMQNTNMTQQTILPQQPRAISLCQVQQPLNLGQVGQQLQFGQPLSLGQVNQPLTFGPAGQPFTLGHVNQTLNLSQVNQVIGNAGQIRFATMPNFGFNTGGQLIGGAGQTILNFQNVPLMQQQLLTSQPTAILGSQPLYIRTAEPFVQQQTPAIAVANVQTVTPIRNVIVPPTVQPTQPRRLQVQPNNAIAPSSAPSVAAKLPAASAVSSSVAMPAAGTKSSPKLVKPHPHIATTVSPVVPKTVVPASAATSGMTHHISAPTCTQTSVRHSKPTMSVSVMPKTTLASITAISVTATSSNIAIAPLTSTVQASQTASCCSSTTVTSPVVSVSMVNLTCPVDLPIPSLPETGKKNEPVSTSISSPKSASVPDKFSCDPIKVDKIKEDSVGIEEPKVIAPATPTKTTAASKHRKPKILTHVIEGFIIQEASEPFPVQGSSLISQLWPPKIPSTTDDGYSSPKSEKESDDGDDEEISDHAAAAAAADGDDGADGGLTKRLKLENESMEDSKSQVAVPAMSRLSLLPTVTSTPVGHVDPRLAAQVDPRLVCEFCGKRDFVNNLTRSRRFCSVTCSKRFSAYSMRKSADGSVIGRPSPQATTSKQSRRTFATGLTRTGTVTTTSSGLTGPTTPVLVGQIQSAVSSDPRVSASANSCTQSDVTEAMTSHAAGVAPGDSSSVSSQSPPALERVERVIEKDSAEDGVLIPARPLAQWGVRDVYDFIRTLPGCGMYADEFRQQEIDGSALMLLKEDHLMMTMNVKLGPALKICSRINSLKD